MVKDARIRRKGSQTKGEVLEVVYDERKYLDESARGKQTRPVHHITYSFTDTEGKNQTNVKTVKKAFGARLKQGSILTVYYLPDRPEENTVDDVITFGF